MIAVDWQFLWPDDASELRDELGEAIKAMPEVSAINEPHVPRAALRVCRYGRRNGGRTEGRITLVALGYTWFHFACFFRDDFDSFVVIICWMRRGNYGFVGLLDGE